MVLSKADCQGNVHGKYWKKGHIYTETDSIKDKNTLTRSEPR